MKKYIVGLIMTLLAVPLLSYGAAQSIRPNRTTEPRSDFIKSITGLSEDEFRNAIGWNTSTGTYDQNLFNAFFEKNKTNRFLSVFTGTLTFPTVAELIAKTSSPRKMGAPRFVVKLFDPLNPAADDITFLQSDPANKGAAFQVASTFWGLEGGMWPYHVKLEKMLHGVQGENASMSTAGAAIYRKYFTQRQHLLTNFEDMVKYPQSTQPLLDLDAVNNYTGKPDWTEVKVGIHKDIFVTHGAVSGSNHEKVSLSEQLLITQILTSAYDLSYAYKNNRPITPGMIKFAQAMLMAAYTGTLRGAYVAQARKIFLTLVGGGAFRNDIEWIGNAIKSNEKFITDAGLDVNLMYRADKDRPLDKVRIRTPEGDYLFLLEMMKMADRINGTNFMDNLDAKNALWFYVKSAYDLSQNSSKQNDNVFMNKLSQYAQILNDPQQLAEYIKSPEPADSLAGVAPFEQKSSVNPPVQAPVQAPFAEPMPSQPTTIALTFSPILTLDSGQVVGWLTIPDVGQVFITLNRGEEAPFYDPNTKMDNFIYANPSYPSIALPAGLYFWKSSNQQNMIGDKGEGVGNREKTYNVQHRPKGKNFMFSRGKYVDTHSKKPWDDTTHNKHPF